MGMIINFDRYNDDEFMFEAFRDSDFFMLLERDNEGIDIKFIERIE